MVSLGFCPNWFFHYSIFFELAFAIITLFVAIYSRKIYRISGEKSIGLFGIAFLLFSFSYFIQTILNIGILYELSKNVSILQKASQTINLGYTALYTHMMVIITGLVILAVICFKARNIKMFFLLLAVSILPIYLGTDPLKTFYILSTIYLIFIASNYLKNYVTKRKTQNLIVFIAFFLLLMSNILFSLSIINKGYFVAAHFFEFATYLLILINLVLVSKK